VTALVFGNRETAEAEALVRRGARVDTLVKAAGLGRVSDVVGVPVDAGADGELHHAAGGGRLELVRYLVEEAGARLDVRDSIWGATPLGWAEHEGKADVAAWLRDRAGTQEGT